MHQHPIEYDIPQVGPIAIDVEHTPVSDTELLVKLQLVTVPKALKWLVPKKYLHEPVIKSVKRRLVREWGEKLLAWADEPTGEADL